MVTIKSNTARPISGVAMRLRASRVLVGLEQTDMAARLNVGRSTISNWERGLAEPQVSHFVRWARITGQPLEWFAERVRPEGFEPPTYCSVADTMTGTDEELPASHADCEPDGLCWFHEPCFCPCHFTEAGPLAHEIETLELAA